MRGGVSRKKQSKEHRDVDPQSLVRGLMARLINSRRNLDESEIMCFAISPKRGLIYSSS